MAKETEKSKDNFSSTAELTNNPGLQSSLSLASKLDEKPYNPFEHRSQVHQNSTIGSILHLLKACLGTGMLAMPGAYKNNGLVAGPINTIIAGVLCTHTVHILVKVSQDVCVDAKKPSMSFAETCGAAFTYGHKRLQPWGTFVKNFVDYSVAVTYISTLCVYVVFIGSSLEEVFAFYLPQYEISVQTCCALTLVPLVLLCQIRNLKFLVPFSLLANVMILVVLGITLYYVFMDLPSPSEREMVADLSNWPLFYSTIVFAIEGIGVVMPVENEMKHPRKFLGCPGVLNTSMVIVVTLFGIIGFFGYLQYGDDVKGSITLNLPQDHITAQTAKLLMALVIFFTYAIQFYVAMEMINRKMKEMRSSNSCNNLIQISIRTIIVIFTVAIGASFPNLELVISFVGAIFLSTLGLLIPSVVQTVYLWERGLGKFNYILYKNILIGCASIFALVSGTYVSAVRMAQELYGSETLEYANETISNNF